MTNNNPAERLLQLREAIAAEYSIPDSDWRIRQLALLMAAQSDAESKLAAGGTIDINQLLAQGDAQKALRADLKISEPTNIRVHVVEGVVGVYNCQHCGQQNRLGEGTYTPPKRPEPAPAPEPLPLPVVAKPAPAAPERRPRPVVASRTSPLSFGNDFDPPRFSDNPQGPSWPNPYRKVD
jgi:hypothetical protein